LRRSHGKRVPKEWRKWSGNGKRIPAAEAVRGYYVLMAHSIFDLIDKKEQT
jgi:hypothetical protein